MFLCQYSPHRLDECSIYIEKLLNYAGIITNDNQTVIDYFLKSGQRQTTPEGIKLMKAFFS